MTGARIRPRGRVPLRPRGARRGDAAARSRRRAHRHHADVSGVWEGGGEYNVARGLKRCFGLRTAIVTALADNPVGRLIEDLIYQGGVEQAHLAWAPYDGVGREVRNGLNFTERGFGVRGRASAAPTAGTPPPRSCARATSTGSGSSAREGARWFHTRRHLLRALGDDAAGRAAKRCGRRAGTARSSRTTSTTATRSGRRRAARERGGRGQSRSSSRSSTCDRQRGGLLGRRSASRSRGSTTTSSSSTSALRAPARAGARRPPGPGARRVDAAPGARPRPSTTGAPCAARARFHVGAVAAEASRSSTASAAATRSPPG